MDWYAYLSLAKELAEPKEGLSSYEKQARQRSAVSRAYYAIFCTVRDIFDPYHKHRPLTEQEGSSHAKLWKQLRTDPDEDRRYIGRQGTDLKESRRQADYDEFVTDLDHVVAATIACAEDLQERLESRDWNPY